MCTILQCVTEFVELASKSCYISFVFFYQKGVIYCLSNSADSVMDSMKNLWDALKMHLNFASLESPSVDSFNYAMNCVTE